LDFNLCRPILQIVLWGLADAGYDEQPAEDEEEHFIFAIKQ